MNKTIGELFNDERTKKLTINYKNKVLIDFKISLFKLINVDVSTSIKLSGL